jgi:hypothetical protein
MIRAARKLHVCFLLILLYLFGFVARKLSHNVRCNWFTHYCCFCCVNYITPWIRVILDKALDVKVAKKLTTNSEERNFINFFQQPDSSLHEYLIYCLEEMATLSFLLNKSIVTIID